MKLLHFMLIAIFLCSCLNDGTDTGNPGMLPGIGDDYNEIKGNEIDALIASTCTLLRDCHAVNSTDCRNGLLAQDNIDTELGLDENEYPTLEDIQQAVIDNEIAADKDNLLTCLDDIDALDCTNPAVGAAYDPIQANPYQGTAATLPPSCTTLY